MQWIQHRFLMCHFKYVLYSGSGHWTCTRLRAIIFKCIISRDKLIFMRDARFHVFNRNVHIIRENEQENLVRNKMRRIRNVIAGGSSQILNP